MNIKSEIFDWNDKTYIKSRIQDKPQQYEDKIIEYLKNGNPIAASASAIHDCFKPNIRIKTTLYTDACWDWNDVLIYYVEKYHFVISKEFLEHMKQGNWKVLKLNNEETLTLINKRLSEK